MMYVEAHMYLCSALVWLMFHSITGSVGHPRVSWKIRVESSNDASVLCLESLIHRSHVRSSIIAYAITRYQQMGPPSAPLIGQVSPFIHTRDDSSFHWFHELHGFHWSL